MLTAEGSIPTPAQPKGHLWLAALLDTSLVRFPFLPGAALHLGTESPVSTKDQGRGKRTWGRCGEKGSHLSSVSTELLGGPSALALLHPLQPDVTDTSCPLPTRPTAPCLGVMVHTCPLNTSRFCTLPCPTASGGPPSPYTLTLYLSRSLKPRRCCSFRRQMGQRSRGRLMASSRLSAPCRRQRSQRQLPRPRRWHSSWQVT